MHCTQCSFERAAAMDEVTPPPPDLRRDQPPTSPSCIHFQTAFQLLLLFCVFLSCISGPQMNTLPGLGSLDFLGYDCFAMYSQDLHKYSPPLSFIHLAGKSLNSQRSFPKLASAPEECESNSRKPFTSCPASSQASRAQAGS